MPIGESHAPAGDFEAEYRGAKEHADAIVTAHVAEAISFSKVGKLSSLGSSCFVLSYFWPLVGYADGSRGCSCCICIRSSRSGSC